MAKPEPVTGVLRTDVELIRGTPALLFDRQADAYYKVAPEMLNILAYLTESIPVSQFREKLQALKLIGPEHCETDSFSSLDYTGKVLVLSPDTLREKFWSPENQLWLALDGFGCSPGAIGRSVRCICLWDGETTRWNRSEFAGVLKEEYLPDWAKEKLEQLRPSAQEPQLSL